MQPFVGCVVTLLEQPPQHAERPWIVWDKRGELVLLVENHRDHGPRMQVVSFMFECRFANWSPHHRRRWD